jgi:hypothetical protein
VIERLLEARSVLGKATFGELVWSSPAGREVETADSLVEALKNIEAALAGLGFVDCGLDDLKSKRVSQFHQDSDPMP